MPEINNKKTVRLRPKKKKMNGFERIISEIIPWKGDSTGEVVRKIIFLVAIAALVYAGFAILDFYVWRDNRNTEDAQYWADVKQENASNDVITLILDDKDKNGDSSDEESEEVEVLAEYVPLYEKNNDFVGWIQMYPYIQYPVVQSTDNEYYLKHNFEGGYNENGTIFADYQGVISATEMPHNTLLYGHNLITNNFFQPLSNFRKQDIKFLQDNYLLEFDTLYERNQYKIFSIFLTNTKTEHGEVFDYWNKVYFTSKSDFNSFVAECLDRSYYYTGVDLEYGDELLTLSTCDFSMFSDMRLVVVARKVRENEAVSMDTSKFIDNTGFDENGNVKRKMFDAYYTTYGCEWAGRSWDTSWIKDFEE
ncbi:MAG: class B sortase [Ruminiclostridium sp.]|nr:class B sortase [Ruminiclostridium sp.]